MATPHQGTVFEPEGSGAWVVGNTGYFLTYSGNSLTYGRIFRSQRPALYRLDNYGKYYSCI